MRQAAATGAPKYLPLLLTTALGSIFAPLNSTMLAVALPEIRDEFSVGIGDIGWLVSAYLIAMAVAQPVGGRLGDQLGRAAVFRIGLVGFLGFSLGAALSPEFPVLVLLRTGQALCGAAIMPNGMAMLRESVPMSRLGRSTGLIGSTTAISAGLGPLVGAALLAAGSWRLLFLMNVPLVALALASLVLLRYPEKDGARFIRFDWLGGIAFAVALTALTYILNSLRGGQEVAALALGVLVFAVTSVWFALRQLRSPTPMAEWSLFRRRSYTGATLYVLLSNLVMYTTLLSIPFFIEEVQGKGSGTTGTLLGAMSLLMALLSPLSGRISDAFGRRPPAMIGSLICLGGVAMLLAGLDQDVPYWYLAVGLATLGLGIGLSFAPANTAAVESAPRELAGAAAGTSSMMRYLGSIIGAGLLGAILTTNGGTPGVDVFRLMFAVLLAISVLAAGAVTMVHRFPPHVEGVRAEPAQAPTA